MENFMNDLEFQGAKIKVIGCGGGGGNAVDHMIREGVKGVDFAIVNTDIQAIRKSLAFEKIQIGVKLTKGLGAGANPEVGRKAAEESIEEIERALEGYDLVFVTAGMGGGTGTGSASVVAELARQKGILTVGVITLPFGFEGRPRMKKALGGKSELISHVDTMITIPNDRLTGHLKAIGKKLNMKKAMEEVNEVLRQAVQGITDLIYKPGIMNVDFADVKTVMQIRGASLMGMGVGVGEDRIRVATEAAMKNPLLEHGIDGAKGLLFNITGNDNLEYDDFVLANEIISGYVDEDCETIIGTVLDETIPEDTVYVTVVATGFDDNTNYPLDNKKVVIPVKENVVQRPTAPVFVDYTKKAPSFKQQEVNETQNIHMNNNQEQGDYVSEQLKNIWDTLKVPESMKNKRGL